MVRDHRKTATRAGVKPMYWLHLHNYAGTLMCNLARQNGEETFCPQGMSDDDCYMKGNCNYPGESCLYGKSGTLPCAAYANGVSEQGVSWVQVERDLHPEDLSCRKTFAYGVLLRDPL